MRGTILAACIAALVAALPAVAQDQEWPEGSAMHVGGLEAKRRDAAVATLAKLHRRLVTLISTATSSVPPDDRLIMAVQAQQVAWNSYVLDECELIGSLTGSGGSWPSTYSVRCHANLLELRIRRTNAAIRCVEKLPAATRQFEQNQCLYQLAPLAVPLRP